MTHVFLGLRVRQSCITIRRTNERTMGAEGKRRLLTLDDITPRLRGATGIESANGCEDERAAHQEKGNRLEWESCGES